MRACAAPFLKKENVQKKKTAVSIFYGTTLRGQQYIVLLLLRPHLMTAGEISQRVDVRLALSYILIPILW